MIEFHIAGLLEDGEALPTLHCEFELVEGLACTMIAEGNWKKPSIKSWEGLLHEYAIQPVQQYDLSKADFLNCSS